MRNEFEAGQPGQQGSAGSKHPQTPISLNTWVIQGG